MPKDESGAYRRSPYSQCRVHVAAALDDHDVLLAAASFPTTSAANADLRRWMADFDPPQRVGVEATGSYGAG